MAPKSLHVRRPFLHLRYLQNPFFQESSSGSGRSRLQNLVYSILFLIGNFHFAAQETFVHVRERKVVTLNAPLVSSRLNWSPIARPTNTMGKRRQRTNSARLKAKTVTAESRGKRGKAHMRRKSANGRASGASGDAVA